MMYVATALNKKYLEYTGVMLTSLCMNNRDEEISVFLLHHELRDDDVESLRRALTEYDTEICPIKIERERFDDRIPRNEKWSIETNYRLMLFDLLPENVDRLLYIDVDMIVNAPIGEMYHRNFNGKNLLVCENAGGYIDTMSRFNDRQKKMFSDMIDNGVRYFNAGMMVMNVENMRKEYNFDVYVEAMKEWDFEMVAPDQDLLNYLHWNQIEYLDSKKYNYFSRIAHEQGVGYEEGKETLGIIHYTDEKPWETRNYHYPIEQIWWDYAKKTPFYDGLMEGFIKRTMADPYVEEWMRDLMSQVENSNEKLGQAIGLIQQLQSMIPGNQ